MFQEAMNKLGISPSKLIEIIPPRREDFVVFETIPYYTLLLRAVIRNKFIVN